ncbi:MAG: mechanosensitive ion channel domain-containing protein [Verrucomicrobiota bacterium]|nr:mechanosensitive ion channel domain-containing protein [Verrucomicrobiota bacterium]
MQWLVDYLTSGFVSLLGENDLVEIWAPWVSRWLVTFLILVLAWLMNHLAKGFMLRFLRFCIKNSKTQWDDKLVQRNLFHRLSHLAPIIVISFFLPQIWVGHPTAEGLIDAFSQIYTMLVVLLVVQALLDAFHDVYRTFEWSKQVPIYSFIQAIKLIVYMVGGVFIVAKLMGKDPSVIFGSLGALTAVLMLVFKDSILGFAAGIHLTTNKMLSLGDWLEMPKYGADGDVIEIGLTTVKVQNFDKTITTIPTYTLISDAFKNWRGMSESPGRRIKRSILIDLHSIRFCDEALLESLASIQAISGYIREKQKEVQAFNQQLVTGGSEHPANGRRLTNIGTFRAYLVAFLRQHPLINQEMTLLVRQLEPTPRGLPLQIYVFSSDKRWVEYEGIVSDLFDHILSVMKEFDLRAYQEPSGLDFHQGLAR